MKLRNNKIVDSIMCRSARKRKRTDKKNKEETVKTLENENGIKEDNPENIDKEYRASRSESDGGHPLHDMGSTTTTPGTVGATTTTTTTTTTARTMGATTTTTTTPGTEWEQQQRQRQPQQQQEQWEQQQQQRQHQEQWEQQQRQRQQQQQQLMGATTMHHQQWQQQLQRQQWEKQQQQKQWEIQHLVVLILCSIALVGILVYSIYIFIIMPNDENDSLDYEKIFNNSLTEMKSGFPNQTSRFWLILTNRGLAHLRNSNPKQPLVIMLGAPPSAHTVVDCLAMRLTRSLDPVTKLPNVFNGSDYSQSDGHVTKKLLDTKLDELFQKGVRSVLVLRLDRLPHPSPVLFYRYCDSETAPYKHPAIIFTVNLAEEPSPLLRPVEAEGLVEKYLAGVVWHKEDDDGIAALLSRVADTVALVNSEGEDVLRTECKRN